MKRTIGIILLTMVLLGSVTHGFEKPDAKTIWTNATPGNRLEPGGSKKNTGYIAGERPGFKTWNWLIYNLGLWTDYLEDATNTLKISSVTSDGHIGQTGDIGIGTSTPTAKIHIVSTGTGAAFRVDTTQQDKAIYVSSTGVLMVSSATIKYYSMNIADFQVISGAAVYDIGVNGPRVYSNHATDPVILAGAIHLPDGATIVKFTAQWNRTVAGASGTARLNHSQQYAGTVEMAEADSTGSGGNQQIDDFSITNPIIGSSVFNRKYMVVVTIDPDAAATDVWFYGILIESTDKTLF